METLDAREILLEGSVNFRDLGGMRTAHGEVIRRGQVFRSDALHALTEDDRRTLAEYAIATLVDLRSTAEITKSGPSPLLIDGTTALHLPVITREGNPSEGVFSQPMEFLYGQFLSEGQAAFARIFAVFAEADRLPAVVHCAAGKDRTGITIALLLRVLGVADHDIAADYAITDRNMERLRARITMPEGVAYPPHVLRALPETMTAFLTALDETWGSADAYLLESGLDADHLTTIRRLLLVTAV